MKIFDLVRKNVIIFSAILVFLLIIINSGILYYNNLILRETTAAKAEAARAKHLTSVLWLEIVKNVDVGVRGFAINRDENMLIPFLEAKPALELVIKELKPLLESQGFPHPQAVGEIKGGIDKFMEDGDYFIRLAREDKMDEFRQVLKEDRGRILWEVYSKNSNLINDFENKLFAEADQSYIAANKRIIYVQIALILLGLPTLLFMIYTIVKDKEERKRLFVELENNNREYLFNPGTHIEVTNEKEVIKNSIKNYKNASSFIKQISQGNYDVKWEELDERNLPLNKTNLTGELVQMREKMKALKLEDEKRNWSTEGLARFSEVIRNHQHNLNELCFEVLTFLVKYMKSQQGGFFVLRETDEETYLELSACYAFNKKKHVEKIVKVGQGLVGQTYKEGVSVVLTEIPQGYTHITSGLGEETPTSLLLVPMKYNEKVEAIIEIASFERYEKYQIEFLERIGEITASTLGAVKNNERTTQLLEQFQSQTEQLRAQEEEMRQNMEEMQATQEAMRRQEKEI